MRFLIPFLLLGGIACFPPQKGSSTGGGPDEWFYMMPFPGQHPSKVDEQASGSSNYPVLYYSGGDGSSVYGQQPSGQGGESAVPGSQYQVAEESWTSSDGEEPVFTPVTDEDQVYSFKSRSRYNTKRFLYNQFRYTPREPLYPQLPVLPYPVKMPQQSKGGV